MHLPTVSYGGTTSTVDTAEGLLMITELSTLELKTLGLLDAEKLSSSDLGRRLKVSRITAARLIQSLRRKGFVLKARREGN